MKIFLNKHLPVIVLFAFVFSSCDKTKVYDTSIPPARAHFLGGKTQVYPVLSDTTGAYTIGVGTTDVVNTDRLVTYNLTSPSGAVAGTQYTIGTSGTVTIPAGQTIAYIDVHGIFSQYTLGQKDTLVFTLSTPSVEPAIFQDTVKLIIKGPCSENSIVLDEITGQYPNTNETLGGSPYGPYITSISSATSTGPTTADIVVQNIFDDGWGPITFHIDWTDPFNTTTVVEEQDAIPGSDAGALNPAYAGMTIAVRPYAVSGPGTYSYCNQTFTLNMQLGVTNLGWFNVLYQVNLER